MAVQPIDADPNSSNGSAVVAARAKTVAIVQSNYIPWKGYFDLIDRADEFILYDDAQYTRRDWRHGEWWAASPAKPTPSRRDGN